MSVCYIYIYGLVGVSLALNWDKIDLMEENDKVLSKVDDKVIRYVMLNEEENVKKDGLMWGQETQVANSSYTHVMPSK